MQGLPRRERPHLPRTGSSLIAVTPVPVRRACRTGPWPSDGKADRGSRRRRRAAEAPDGTLRCRRSSRPASVADPGSGHEPGNVTAEVGRLRFGPPGRGRTWLPGASAPCLGITLSDVEGQGERAHSRRSVRPRALRCSPDEARRSGRSGSEEQPTATPAHE
jgi:hypothetical protein